jgi:hypothetical protein
MRQELLQEADRIVGALSPGRREAVRELVINTTRRGVLDDRARAFLDRASGGSLLSEVLAQAIAETDAPGPRIRRELSAGGDPGSREEAGAIPAGSASE